MGSVEGTYVNGKRVNKGKVAFGDEIRVGGTTIRLENPAAVAAVNLAAAVSSTDVTTQGAGGGCPRPQALAQAASAPVAAEPAPVAVAPSQAALDESFAATQQHEVVAPVAHEPQRRSQASPRRACARAQGARRAARWARRCASCGAISAWASSSSRPGRARSFTVGSAAGVDFVMGDARLGGPSFEVVRTDGQTFTVCFTGKMKGELTRKGETLDLVAVIESGKATPPRARPTRSRSRRMTSSGWTWAASRWRSASSRRPSRCRAARRTRWTTGRSTSSC